MPINTSKPRRIFKEMLGHSNHYVVTILVGLEAVATMDLVAPGGLRAAWSPKSPIESARRSRPFALSAATAWAIDAVDAYFSLALRSPSIVESETLREALQAAGRSVSAKVCVCREAFPDRAPIAGALVALAVIWRNRVIHSLADNEVPDALREQLRRSVDDIRNDYRGLDVDRTILAAARADAPTLKEATSVIAACHAFVAGIDAALLAELSVERYAKDVIVEHLSQAGRRNVRDQLAMLWAKDIDRRRRSIGQALQSTASVAMPDQALDEWVGHLIEMWH